MLTTTFIQIFPPSMRHSSNTCKPSFINPKLLEDQSISLEKLLEDKAAGMAFPSDAKYFDNFPVIRGVIPPPIAPWVEVGKSLTFQKLFTVLCLAKVY